MDRTSLYTKIRNYQTFYNFFMDEKLMDRPFRNFVDGLIRENATRDNDQWTLYACDLSHADKKLFLSYLIDSELFNEITGNHVREHEAFKEFEQEMQYFINNRIDIVYFEYMDEKKNDSDSYSCLTTSLT